MIRLGIVSFFVTSFLLISISTLQIDVKIQFITDILLNENVPSTIVVKASCWPKREMIAFFRALNFSVEFSNDNVVMNQRFDEHSHKVWFFVDMQCEGSLEFVTMVNKSVILL